MTAAVAVAGKNNQVFLLIFQSIATIWVQPNIADYLLNLLEHCLGHYVTEMGIPSLQLRHDYIVLNLEQNPLLRIYSSSIDVDASDPYAILYEKLLNMEII
jgi:hypothetical protein